MFHILEPELPGHAHAHRSAVTYGKLLAVHAVGKESLWMQCVGHVQTVPPCFIEGKVRHVLCLRPDSHKVQNRGKLHSYPFGDERPSFLARLKRYLSS